MTQPAATRDPAALLRVVADGTDRQARELLTRSGLPAAVLHAIADRFADDPAMMSLLANHDDCPAALLSDLARHPHVNVRALVAANPSLPEQSAWELADDPDAAVRAQLTGNPALPWSVAVVLTFHTSAETRYAATRVAGMPDHLGEWNRWVRMNHWAAAPDTPVEVFARLAEAERADVRQAVADNPAAPDELRVAAALS